MEKKRTLNYAYFYAVYKGSTVNSVPHKQIIHWDHGHFKSDKEVSKLDFKEAIRLRIPDNTIVQILEINKVVEYDGVLYYLIERCRLDQFDNGFRHYNDIMAEWKDSLKLRGIELNFEKI